VAVNPVEFATRSVEQAFRGPQQARGPQHARCSRDGVEARFWLVGAEACGQERKGTASDGMRRLVSRNEL